MNIENIVFIDREGEYQASETMPPFAKRLEEEVGFNVTYLDEPSQGEIPNLNIIDQADLLILYFRFRQSSDEQLKKINEYFEAGKPAIALRTSTFAFRGSGGVYLSGRYEIQILDSYGDNLSNRSIGAIYEVKTPDLDAAKPAGEWQSMTIEYSHSKNQNSVISVWLNKQKIHSYIKIEEPTSNGFLSKLKAVGNLFAGSIRLQADASRIRYANI